MHQAKKYIYIKKNHNRKLTKKLFFFSKTKIEKEEWFQERGEKNKYRSFTKFTKQSHP